MCYALDEKNFRGSPQGGNDISRVTWEELTGHNSNPIILSRGSSRTS